MKIVVIRHGKPNISISKPVNSIEFGESVKAYNDAGIKKASKPPEDAVKEYNNCNKIICSDLPRSVESAKLLTPKKQIHQDSLFREVEMPHGTWRTPRLRPESWLIIFRIFWIFGYSKNVESFKDAKQRAKRAAHNLVTFARKYESVGFVGHGALNGYIVRELKKQGWIGPGVLSNKYWSFGIYYLNKTKE
ncbi:hypothetical protein B6I21_03420 [candidate division KSB1 bacterium 4572_119]|nr:MAG: hypothetical protein B6I21_03420 [candidate division KSB1 bacterium 4572_119]